MSNQNQQRHSAVCFIRKLRGNSQSALVEASNGLLYVVKWQINPQSAAEIPSEALGASIYDRFRLPIPSWEQIEVSDDFLNANPSMWFELQTGVAKPRSGFHFASRYLEEASNRVFEILPGSWHGRIQNRPDFWGALAVDVWLDSCHNRQALFVKDAQSPKLRAFFISHSHIQAGFSGQLRKSLLPYLYPDKRIYPARERENAISFWVEQIERRGGAVLLTALRDLRVDIAMPVVRDFTERLLTRAYSLRKIVSSMDFEFA